MPHLTLVQTVFRYETYILTQFLRTEDMHREFEDLKRSRPGFLDNFLVKSHERQETCVDGKQFPPTTI